MILFFDTETTGLARRNLPPDDPSQPRIVQLGAQLVDDLSGRVESSINLIVNPMVEIPEKVSAIHGITTARAQAAGVPTATAIRLFGELYRRADLCVAHNAGFDKLVVEAEIYRVYSLVKPLDRPFFCTMEAARAEVNLPPTPRQIEAGFAGPKAPKLAECIKHFFGEELSGAHDALVDVDACRRVYFHLKSIGRA